MSDLDAARPAGAAARASPGTTLPDRRAPSCSSDGLGGVCLFGSNTADGPARSPRVTARCTAACPRRSSRSTRRAATSPGCTRSTAARCSAPAALGAGRRPRPDPRRPAGDRRRAGRGRASTSTSARSPTSTATPTTRSSAPAASAPTRPVAAAHVAAWVDGPAVGGRRGVRQALPRPRRHRRRTATSRCRRSTSTSTTLAARELVPFAAAVEAGVGGGDDLAHRRARARPRAAGDPERAGARRCCASELGFDGRRSSATPSTWPGASAGARHPARPPCSSLAAGADLLCLGAGQPVDAGATRSRPRSSTRSRPAGCPSERLEEAADAGEPPPGVGCDGRAAPRRRACDARMLADGAARSVTVDGRAARPARRPRRAASTRPAPSRSATCPWGLPADAVVAPGSTACSGRAARGLRSATRTASPTSWPRSTAAGRGAVVVEWGWPGPYDRTRRPASARVATPGTGRAAVTRPAAQEGRMGTGDRR